MHKAVRGSLLAAFALLLVISSVASTASNTRDDTPGNDSFGTASPIVYSTEVQTGGLDASDQADFYLIQDLIGDTVNDQMDSQIIEISVKSTSGSDIIARVYEPNELEVGEMRSSGGWDGIEFVVPYDGDYYLAFETDPQGQSATYEFLLGGQLDYDNRPYTKNNQPGEFIFTQTRKVSLTLNPVRNVIDYYTIDLESGWGLQSRFMSDYPMRLQLLTSSFDEYGTTEGTDPLEVRNSGELPLRVHVRMNYPLLGAVPYDPVNRPYDLYLDVWSFLTVPEVPVDWPALLTLDEDPQQPLILNLSQHFIEPNGDPLSFAVISSNSGLSVTLNNVTTSYGDPLYTEAIIMPEANWFGTEDVGFRCSDKDLAVTDGLQIKVSSVNDLPFVTKIGNATYEGGTFHLGVPEDVVLTFPIEYGDVDDDVNGISFSIDVSIPFVDVDQNDGTMRINPQQRDVGYYNFNLIVVDPSGGRVEISMNLTVIAVNDRPPEPTWSVISGNITSILPGESITIKALSEPDPDGDILTFTWDWGDGTTSTGVSSSHSYASGIYGNRTIRLISSDGQIQNETLIRIHIKSPEDIAVGDLKRTVQDPVNDPLEFREEWGSTSSERMFRLVKSTDVGCDIISVRTVRRVNEVQVYLELAGNVMTDGQYRYEVFIIDGEWSEIQIDPNATTSWGLIPSFQPTGRVLAHQAYIGVLDINSTGTIMEGRTIMFSFDIMALNRSGADLPLNRSDISVFCTALLTLEERTTGKVSMRSIVYDSAGDGSCPAPELKTKQTRGGGSSPIGDLAEGPGLYALIALALLMLVLGAIGFLLMRRENKRKKEEEKRFIADVEKMRSEGRDLFERVKEEGPKKVSYEELYGHAPPKGFAQPTGDRPPDLPGPGLAGAGKGDIPSPPVISDKVNWEE